MERPTTQNLIGKAKTVKSKELGASNPRIRHAELYLSRLADNETSATPGSPNSDFLRFNPSISTSNNELCSAYSLLDCGTSHSNVETTYGNPFGLKRRLCRQMTLSVAGEEKVEDD